jgi:hypothetical protein
MKTYYYEYNGHQIGPVTFEELEKKKIEPTTLVWYEGLTEWVEAKNISELKGLFSAMPPPINKPPIPVRQENNTLPIGKTDHKILLIFTKLGILLSIISIFLSQAAQYGEHKVFIFLSGIFFLIFCWSIHKTLQ